MYSPRDLAALVAVADMGSVRGAAAALRKTQPAITQAIRRLEESVGFVLLDRSSYRARLTERASTFVERARRIVSESRSLHNLAALLSNGIEPCVRLVVDSAAPARSWIELVSAAPASYPDTAIEVEDGEGASPLNRLLDETADLAIMFDVAVNQISNTTESKRLGEAEFVNIVRVDKLDLLADAPCNLPQIVVADFARPTSVFGVADGQRCWRVSTHQMQAEAIVAGLGWGSVPRFLVSTAIDQGLVKPVSFSGASAESRHSFSLYRKRERVLGPVANSIWNKL